MGRRIVGAIPDRQSAVRGPLISPSELGRLLNQALDRVHALKRTLLQVDGQIRELKMESIHEDLLNLQRDLSLRSAALERFLVAPASPVDGKSLNELSLPSSVRLVTIFRGPFLIPPSEGFVFRADDVAILVGLRVDLDKVAMWFAPVRKARSA
jgi:NhaP-type Na+/H+ and K+/H+ antiporter